MDGILSDGRKGKMWLCRKNTGHVLGLVVSCKRNGATLDSMVIFRHAVEVADVAAAVVLGSVDSMNDIECDICNAKRTWHIGEAALDRFIEKRQMRSEVKNENEN